MSDSPFPSLEFRKDTLIYGINTKIKQLEERKLRSTSTETQLKLMKGAYDALRMCSQEKITLTFDEFMYYVHLD